MLRKSLIPLPIFVFVALVLSAPSLAADAMTRDVWHSHILLCVQSKEFAHAGPVCHTLTSRKGVGSYTACIEQGLAFKEFFYSEEFARNRPGQYFVVHSCVDVETNEADEASQWEDKVLLGDKT